MAVIEQDLVQTETTIETPLLFTPEASNRLLKLMQEKELDSSEYALRVFVAGGGCSGLQYGMTFDDEVREGDSAFVANGLRVLVDHVSNGYLAGSTVDYVDTMMGGGFKIDNPNSAGGCGCGKSFRAQEGDDEAEEAAGGCGSCSSH
ncbi:MAG: iron-sulfur cluster assembly accessory protein [Chloroflexaceae bacterium]|nr:iron-sulfur cluster assembly accessory protein [Chloroflexaceae bacterium]NJO04687.1 iron-sulfur cluster assembly accessory protein [Chloroflexaceae bacterium]